MLELKARLRGSLPDEPLWVEARDLLAWPGSRCQGEVGAFAVWSGEDELGALVGSVCASSIHAAAAECSELLAYPDNVEAACRVLELWTATRATILAASARVHAVESHPTIELTPQRLEVEPGLSVELREELVDAASDGSTIYASLEGSRAVSFAYAASQTETLFDVSIDTLASHRRRGFARSAVSRLIREMSALNKTAVWGAARDNPASLQLATRLGFVPVGSLYVLRRGSGHGALHRQSG